MALSTSIPPLLDRAVPAAPTRVLGALARSALVSLNLAFAVVYPHLALPPRRRPWMMLALAPSALLILFIASDPSSVLGPSGQATDTTRMVDVLVIASHLPALWVFGRHWLTAAPGTYRTQYLLVLVPYLLWNLTDAVFALSTAFREPGRFGPGLLGLALTLSLLQAIAVLILGAATPVRAAVAGRDTTREERVLVASVFVGLLLSWVQFLGPRGPVVVTGLLLPVLFFGAGRFQVVDLDLRVKRTLPYGVVVGIGGLAVFLLEQTAQFYAGDAYGLAGALAVAGLVVLLAWPIRLAAKRLVNRLMPGVEPTQAYLAHRRLELYQAALEGVLKDRVIERVEAEALGGLREHLSVSVEEHDALERQIRARMGAPARAS